MKQKNALYIYDPGLGSWIRIKIDLLQSQCEEKIGDCTILLKQFNLENNSTLEVEVFENINAIEFVFTDFFKYNSFKIFSTPSGNIIYYVGSKILPFGSKNIADYLTVRAINYTKPFKNQTMFSKNLDFSRNSTAYN